MKTQIFKNYSSPVRFYDDNEVAFKDIERCAQEEIKTTTI